MFPIFRRRALCLIAAATFATALAGCSKPAPAASSAIGGPFSLVNQDGQPVTEKVLKGHWSAVYFGYTYCPDVCPATLQALGEAQAQLGRKADRLQVVFITVDPERDNPKALKSYLSSAVFPKGTMGLTGTPQQVAAAAKAYRLPYSKQGTGKDYTVNHASMVYLMNPDGKFVAPLSYGLTPAEMAKQISTAMG